MRVSHVFCVLSTIIFETKHLKHTNMNHFEFSNQHIYVNDRVIEFRMVTNITILKTPNILYIDGRFDA
jgi:hypothetical protein